MDRDKVKWHFFGFYPPPPIKMYVATYGWITKWEYKMNLTIKAKLAKSWTLGSLWDRGPCTPDHVLPQCQVPVRARLHRYSAAAVP